MIFKSELTFDVAELTLNDLKIQTPANLKAFLHIRGKHPEKVEEHLLPKRFVFGVTRYL